MRMMVALCYTNQRIFMYDFICDICNSRVHRIRSLSHISGQIVAVLRRLCAWILDDLLLIDRING